MSIYCGDDVRDDDRWPTPGGGSPFLFQDLTPEELEHVGYAIDTLFGIISEETTFEEWQTLQKTKRGT